MNGRAETHPAAGGAASANADATLDSRLSRAQSLVDLSQGNVQAILHSSQTWAAGFEEIYKTFAAAAQAQLDQSLFIWKALSGAKSFGAAMEMQSTLARTAFDAAVLETAKAAGASAKLAGATMEPVAKRIAHVIDISGAAGWPRHA